MYRIAEDDVETAPKTAAGFSQDDGGREAFLEIVVLNPIVQVYQHS